MRKANIKHVNVSRDKVLNFDLLTDRIKRQNSGDEVTRNPKKLLSSANLFTINHVAVISVLYFSDFANMILSSLCRINVCIRITRYARILCADVNTNLALRTGSFQLLQNSPAHLIANQWDRSFRTSCNTHYRNARPVVKPDQFAVSHPRQYKLYEREKQKDSLPEDWQLIFSSSGYGKKLDIIHWLTFGVLCVSPFAVAYGWWEFQVEENIIFASVEVSKRTEFMMFLLINFLIAQASIKTVSRIPKRMYFNEEADRYLAVLPRYFPWKSAKVEFKSTDIFDLPSKKLPIRLKPWGDQEFRVKNQIMLLPVMSFRSGHDYDWMMRSLYMSRNIRR